MWKWFRNKIHAKGKTLIFCMLAILCICNTSNADWRDKLKDLKEKTSEKVKEAKEKTSEKVKETKEKWQERERLCSECGKVIHFGTKCSTCQAKEAAEKARQLREKAEEKTKEAKQKWNERERQCSECGKTIHLGTKCRTCQAKEVTQKSKQFYDSAREGTRKAHDWGTKTWQEMKPKIQDARERAAIWCQQNKTTMVQKAQEAKEAYSNVANAIRDPEVRQEAMETLGAMMEMRRQMKDAKREATYRGLTMLAAVPIRTEYGEVPLGEMATSRLTSRFPALKETGICDDPAASITALCFRDRDFLMNNVKLIEKGGQKMSITEAIQTSNPFNTSKTIKYLTILEATEEVSQSVTTGEGGLEALESVASAIKAVSPGTSR